MIFINQQILGFIKSTIPKYLDKLMTKSKHFETTDKKSEHTLITPFLGKQSNIIKKILRKLFSSLNPNAKWKIVFKTGKKLVNIFSYKDKSPFYIQPLISY